MKNFILDDSEFMTIEYFDNDFVLNYENVLGCASVLASHYDSCVDGVQQGICILMPRGAHYLAAIFAAWRAGFYVVPLNTAWPEQKNLDIIKKIQPAAVLLDDGMILSTEYSVLMRSSLFQPMVTNEVCSMENLPASLLFSDVAYVIFTSGSTGEPKGVVISVGAFRSYIDWTRRFFSAYAESRRLLLTSDLTFDITMGDIAFALAFGTSIGVAKNNTNIPSVLAMVMRHKIDVLYSVPTTHLALAAFAKQKKGADLSTLRLIMSGGDRFPWQLVRDYVELASEAHFYNVYGPTEVTINCFSVRLDDKLVLEEKNKPVPIGSCFDSLDFVLLDDDDKVSEEGELCVTGAQLMLGYYGDRERTQSAFVEDPRLGFVSRLLYRTGDIGYMDEGLVYLKGRIDGLLKIRGYRIHPDEVSRAIEAVDGVDLCSVIPFGAQSEAALVAFVLMQIGMQISGDDITTQLREELPSYMIPIKYIFVDDFPLNQSGKIDKKALARRL